MNEWIWYVSIKIHLILYNFTKQGLGWDRVCVAQRSDEIIEQLIDLVMEAQQKENTRLPVLTREWIRFWLEKFRKGDVGSTEHQRQIIDTFVNSVYIFDDRVVLNFNFTDDAKTVTREEVLGSSAVDNAPPD